MCSEIKLWVRGGHKSPRIVVCSEIKLRVGGGTIDSRAILGLALQAKLIQQRHHTHRLPHPPTVYTQFPPTSHLPTSHGSDPKSPQCTVPRLPSPITPSPAVDTPFFPTRRHARIPLYPPLTPPLPLPLHRARVTCYRVWGFGGGRRELQVTQRLPHPPPVRAALLGRA